MIYSIKYSLKGYKISVWYFHLIPFIIIWITIGIIYKNNLATEKRPYCIIDELARLWLFFSFVFVLIILRTLKILSVIL